MNSRLRYLPSYRHGQQVFGLHIGRCIASIMRGEVALEDVAMIFDRTAFWGDQWVAAITDYQRMYWAVNPAKGERILRELIDTCRIDQPRLYEDAPRMPIISCDEKQFYTPAEIDQRLHLEIWVNDRDKICWERDLSRFYQLEGEF